MKKALLFTIAILFAMAAVAQNRAILLQESFDASGMPAGWGPIDHNSNWSISSSQNAGGTANELKLYYNPQFNGTTHFVSPAVDLTGITSVIFSFKHCLDNYSGAHTLGIATSSDNGTTWNTGWSQSYSSDGVWTVNQEISTSDMGNNNVKFCIFYTGNSYNIDNWYFDDILVFTLEDLDLGLTGSSVPAFLSSGEYGFDMTVFNYGSTPVTSVEASYSVDGVASSSQVFNVNIPSLASATLTFDDFVEFIPGSYTVDFSIDKVNGENDNVADNNMMSKSFYVALTSAERIPMIEHFSSSTCGPCVSVNTQMLNFCNNNPGRFTYTKYQMNWPGNGDPYYTDEGGVRRNYYGVSAVPQCFLDGVDQGFAAVQQSVFDQHADIDAFMDIRGSFSVQGNVVHVLVDVMPYIDAEARVYVSINEKTTHNNVGGNGETSFHHIFMKMLPNAQGTPCTFNASELQQLEFTQDMSGTHVEEMDDLEVSIWVQNFGTHEILNSHFAYEYTTEHPYPVENLSLTENPTGGYQAIWSAPTNGNPLGYDVYVNGELAESGTTATEYQFQGDPDGFNFVEVIALYAEDMTSVKAAVSLETEPVFCDPVSELTAEPYEYQGARGALVTWTEPEGTIGYDVYVGDDYLGTASGSPVFIGFEGEEQGTYTIGIVALYDDCESEMVTVDFYWDFTSVEETAMVTTIYPNPASSNFTIECANDAMVEIYNLVGQKVYSAQGKVFNVDSSNWDKGIYLVNVKDQKGAVKTQKLVVR